MIIDNRVIVDGKNVGHDGTLPLSWVAIDAVVARVARPLGRPVHAVATDASGTSTLVIHLDGALSDIEQVGDGMSEHFPPRPHAAKPPTPTPAPASSTSRAFSRWRLLGAATAITLVVGLLGAVAQNSSSTPAERPASAPISATSPTQDQSPVSQQLAPEPVEEIAPVIQGIARHARGGPVRLAVRSTVAPLKVRVALFPVGRAEDAVVRQIRIGESGLDGKTVVVFSDLPEQIYRWRVMATGAEPKTGTVRVLGSLPVAAPEPEAPATVVPRSAPTPAPSPSRPPRGPRDNTPIPPTPQP